MRAALSGLLLTLSLPALAQRPIEITFLHTNDLHAHVEPTAIKGKTYGGYARIATLANAWRAKESNVVLLNAGDTFQGTLYFNVYEGLADAQILNRTGYAATTLGNHEFDRGTGPTTAFAKALSFPIVCCNLRLGPQQAEFARRIVPSTILTVGGQKVGVVGVVTPDTPNISSPGPGVTFLDPLASAQAEVDRLTKAGVNKIVLLTHIGYDEDKALAAKLRDVDLIIGGHSHTPLGTPGLPGWREAAGPYPTIVKAADGHDVPIVQAWEWGKVLGRIRLAFDAAGNLTRVVAAEPIPVDESVAPDPGVQTLVEAFAKPIAAVAAGPVGSASESIEDRALLGQVIADSLLEGGRPSGAVVAFMNPGGVRANLEKGTVTYGAASSIVPFRNTLVLLDMTGAEILAALGQLPLLPSEGTTYRLVGGKPADVVLAGVPLDPARTYRVATLNFLANGGDSVFAFRDAKGKRTDTGKIDIDLWTDYLKAHPNLKAPANRIAR